MSIIDKIATRVIVKTPSGASPIEPVVSREKVDHKILFDTVDDMGITKTTHDKITYDTLTEAFIVDLTDGCWCEVYGLGRFNKAVSVADNFSC